MHQLNNLTIRLGAFGLGAPCSEPGRPGAACIRPATCLCPSIRPRPGRPRIYRSAASPLVEKGHETQRTPNVATGFCTRLWPHWQSSGQWPRRARVGDTLRILRLRLVILVACASSMRSSIANGWFMGPMVGGDKRPHAHARKVAAVRSESASWARNWVTGVMAE
jgi:hypothetical protein